MVALDGLEITLLRRAFESGRLPNLRAFSEASQELSVVSDGERLEGTVWPTFATGTGPGTHGHHWFYQWVPEEGRFAGMEDPRFAIEPFWKEALEAGRRVICLDIPYLRPLGHANERTYNGWGLQDEMAQHAHPRSFGREIRRKHGRSKVEKDTLLVRTPDDRLKLARRLRSGARQRSAVLLDLVQRRDWELMLLGFGEFHLGGHHLALPMELTPKVTSESALVSILKPVDDAWPEIVKAAGEDCDIFLFAVHGMRPMSSYAESVQHILHHLEGRPPIEPPRSDALRFLRDLLPPGLHQAIWWRLPAAFRMQRMMQAWMARMDLAHDRVFVFEGDCAVALRLNVQGRERDGIVPPEEGQQILRSVFEEAMRYTTEDGKRPFEELAITGEVWSGARLDMLPDAMMTYNPEVLRARTFTRDDGFQFELQIPESRNGIHTGRGFAFYRAGSPVELHRTEFENVDFAPTIMQLLDVEPGAHLEGQAFAS